jgi:hypothetical protein
MYDVTEEGKVFSLSNWKGIPRREVAQSVNGRGYMQVRMVVDGVRKHFVVHKLVATKFHGERPSPAHEICHINGDRTDNRAINLRWGTRQENMIDRDLHGRTSKGLKHSVAIKRGFAEKRGAA